MLLVASGEILVAFVLFDDVNLNISPLILCLYLLRTFTRNLKVYLTPCLAIGISCGGYYALLASHSKITFSNYYLKAQEMLKVLVIG